MEETLNLVKETKNTVVYGNDTIQSIYLPKNRLEGNDYPKQIKIVISW